MGFWRRLGSRRGGGGSRCRVSVLGSLAMELGESVGLLRACLFAWRIRASCVDEMTSSLAVFLCDVLFCGDAVGDLAVDSLVFV